MKFKLRILAIILILFGLNCFSRRLFTSPEHSYSHKQAQHEKIGKYMIVAGIFCFFISFFVRDRDIELKTSPIHNQIVLYFEDMSIEMENFFIERMRSYPPWEKSSCVQKLIQSAETMALAGLRNRYPKADENELKMRLASLRLDSKIMKEVFHWNPDEKGL